MRRIALLLFAALTLGLPIPTAVSAVPSIFGCSQKANGVIGFHANDPGWIDENGEHGDGFWFRWRIHGPGVDEILYEGNMPRQMFETDARIWGLQDGKTYKIEYAEEVPGYSSFESDILSCTVQGATNLPFGFDLSIDGRATTYPKEPTATPAPTPKPTATPTPTPTPKATPKSTATPTATPVVSPTPSVALSPSLSPVPSMTPLPSSITPTPSTPLPADLLPSPTADDAGIFASLPIATLLPVGGGLLLLLVLLLLLLFRRRRRR